MQRKSHIIDATDKIAGRLASRIAFLLQGKHKASYQAHLDEGDIVIVQNVGQMKFSGKKLEQKIYYRHTGYPGGIRTAKLSDRVQKNPRQLLMDMIWNMLPDNKLRNPRIKRLRFEK